MSLEKMKAVAVGRRAAIEVARHFRPALPILSVTAMALLAGCSLHKNRDSIEVGAIPDDYRTSHPIVIGEKEQILDLPVAASDRGATGGHRASLEGFLAGYDRGAAPVLKIMVPAGAANDLAAGEAARDFAHIARRNGVPASRIMITSYGAGAYDVSAPVRIAFTATRAHTGKCGRWPADMLETSENKHYADFGCSSQNNLAAQVANPSDLLGPRKQSPIDAANRGAVIGEYQKAPAPFEPTTTY